jgi:hypothetical protein
MPFPSAEHQWKPGQSGNPGGRPKGRSILARVRDLLDRTTDLDGKLLGDGRMLADVLAETVVRTALEGDLTGAKAWKDLLTFLEGRPRQSAPEEAHSTVRDAALARLREIHEPERPGIDSAGT